METQYKKCTSCNGKGRKIQGHIYEGIILPKFKKCIYCDGSGQVELDETEMQCLIENLKYGHNEKY